MHLETRHDFADKLKHQRVNDQDKKTERHQDKWNAEKEENRPNKSVDDSEEQRSAKQTNEVAEGFTLLEFRLFAKPLEKRLALAKAITQGGIEQWQRKVRPTQRRRAKLAKQKRAEDPHLPKRKNLQHRRRASLKKSRPKRHPLRRPCSIPVTSRSRCELISFPSAGGGWLFQATPIPTGLKPSGSSSLKLATDAVAAVLWAAHKGPEPPQSGIENSAPGKHSLILSSNRLIANGFAIKPATPGSFNNSCARFSSALPETRISGGTSRIGSMFW